MITQIVGIDAGLETFGICIYTPANGSLEMFDGDFQQGVNFIGRKCRPDTSIFVVEDPNMNGAVFGGWAKFQALGANKSAFNRLMKHAQGVGEVKAAAKLIIKMLNRAGYQIARVAPSERDNASTKRNLGKDVRLLRMPTKTTKEQFEKLTGYAGKSLEHSQDAATLVYGRTVKNVELLILTNHSDG